MTDDAFHLTALDARRYDFGNALRGYDRARVDQFRDQVAEELERMSRVNQELEAKARNFHEQLRAFRERDKALNEALISAQQLRGEIREQAQREAQLIIREAQGEADRALEGIRSDVRRAEDDLQQLWRARRTFLAQMRNAVERQLTELEAAEREPAPQHLPDGTRDAVRETPKREVVRETVREVAAAPTAAPAAAPFAAQSAPAPVAAPVVVPPAPLAPPAREVRQSSALDEPIDIASELRRDLPIEHLPESSRPGSLTPSWLDVVEEEGE